MKTRQYLDELLGSKSRIAVLRTLFRHPQRHTTPLQIAHSAKDASRTPVLRAVKQLEAKGILTMESHGHAHLVKLNKKNAAYPVLENLFEYERKSWTIFVSNLKKVIPAQAVSCVLFGSVARGEEDQGSDVDLLLILPSGVDKSEIEESLPTFLEAYDLPIGWYVLTEAEFKRKKGSQLLKSIKKDYEVIKGVDPWQM